MEANLAIALVNKGVLPVGTEVEARFNAVGLGSINNVQVVGEFSIANVIVKDDGKVVFDLRMLRDGSATQVLAESILTIDGMDPVRYASVYNVTANGGTQKQGKRRGRKPKNRKLEELEG